MKYTAEEVRAIAKRLHDDIAVADGDALMASDMLTAYADSLEWAQGGVTDGVVDVAHDTIFGHPSFDIGENGFLGKPAVRAALLAVWPTTTNPSETGSKLVDAELYKSACDSAEEWKARALKAERITEQLGDALNDMTGPTFMGEPVLSKPVAQHPDDAAVDAFAMAMKAKLAEARAKGRGGWQDKADCPQQRLSDMLRAHVAKGDPRDVANFCMFLHQRGESILPAEPVAQGEVCKICGKDTPHHHLRGTQVRYRSIQEEWSEYLEFNLACADAALRKLSAMCPITPPEAACIKAVITGARAMLAALSQPGEPES